MKPKEREEILEDPARLLFERYYRAVVSYFRRLGFSQDEARNLAQEVFVRVCQSVKDYEGKAGWAYLETIARRIAINEFRRRSAGIRLGEEIPLDANSFLAEILAGSFSTPEAELLDEEEQALQRQWLQEAIQELPGNIQRCLRLWMSGLKYREIQKVEGITIDTVKGRLNEARNRLRARRDENPGRARRKPEVTPEVDRDQES